VITLKSWIYFAVFFIAFANANGQGQVRQIKLLFAGDVMGHDGQIKAATIEENELYDYTPCFQFVKDQVSNADIAIANLELTLPGKPPYTGYPQFKSPSELALALKDAGFDLLVTANNHSNDAYASGLKNTLDVLDGYGFLHTGTFRNEEERMLYYPLLIYKNDFKIAFLNYTYGTNGIPTRAPTVVNLIDPSLIKKDLEEAKRLKPDVIVVIMHWGDEYQLRENQEQRDLAKMMFDEGADLIIGAHPHVVQPIKEQTLGEQNNLKKGLVAYSLGNYISGQTRVNTDGGIMLEITLEKDMRSGEVQMKNHAYTPVWRHIQNKDGKKEYVLLTQKELEAKHEGLLETIAMQKMKSFLKNLNQHLDKFDANLNTGTPSGVDVK
jgi:poly-gamma-glutamate capsule biosynthesis protein CapA/YwtB (metallophosphatase superfamily)